MRRKIGKNNLLHKEGLQRLLRLCLVLEYLWQSALSTDDDNSILIKNATPVQITLFSFILSIELNAISQSYFAELFH